MEEKRCLLLGVVMVVVGGVLLVAFSGSAALKDVVAHNKICQNLQELDDSDYKDCQAELDVMAEQLLESEVLDLHACKYDSATVRCPVRVWYVVRYLVITSPTILQQVIQINAQPTDEGVRLEVNQEPRSDPELYSDNAPRSKREVLKKNEQRVSKNKCDKCNLNDCWDLLGCC